MTKTKNLLVDYFNGLFNFKVIYTIPLDGIAWNTQQDTYIFVVYVGVNFWFQLIFITSS